MQIFTLHSIHSIECVIEFKFKEKNTNTYRTIQFAMLRYLNNLIILLIIKNVKREKKLKRIKRKINEITLFHLNQQNAMEMEIVQNSDRMWHVQIIITNKKSAQ